MANALPDSDSGVTQPAEILCEANNVDSGMGMRYITIYLLVFQ